MADTKYQAYFKKTLSQHGHESPKDIPKGKKDDFFKKIDKGWKAKHETDKTLSRAAYLCGCLDLMEQRNDSGEADSTIS